MLIPLGLIMSNNFASFAVPLVKLPVKLWVAADTQKIVIAID